MSEIVTYLFINPASSQDAREIQEYIINEPAFTHFTKEEDFLPYAQSDGTMQLSSRVLPLDYNENAQMTLSFLSFLSKHAAFEFQKETVE